MTVEPRPRVFAFEYLAWRVDAICGGQSKLFFPGDNERAPSRIRREKRAHALCARCPVLTDCRAWARANREYGYWGGETEEERARLGCGPPDPIGRVYRATLEHRKDVG